MILTTSSDLPNATSAPPRVTTLDGSSISGSIAAWDASGGGITPHAWTADANGLFHTTTDLATEWQGLYQKLLDPSQQAQLAPWQRLEANAEAVFLNTGLNKLPADVQERDREDAQREIDAIAAGMKIDQTQDGIDPNQQFNTQTYAQLEHTIQGNETLEELAVQGHGLNSPPDARYDGYTNDFQNNVDNATKYVGGGNDNGEKAIAALFDDDIMTHVPFPVVHTDGQLIQLNQNGANEDPLQTSVDGMNQSMYVRVYVAGDFSKNSSATGPVVDLATVAPVAALPVATGNAVTTLYGGVISGTITGWDTDPAGGLTPHTWTADANGLFHTSTDLAAEWQGFYQRMLDGQGASLTAWQRLEGNAEAVFENTGLDKLNAATQQRDREDAQREIDAIAAGMKIDQATLGVDPNAEFTVTTYLELEHTVQFNDTLSELAVQGHGLNKPPSAKYDGYTNDFQNNVDDTTKYIGGGNDNGEKAITDLFDDDIMTHIPFPTVEKNGHLEQLNQNGDNEDRVADSVAGANQSMFERVYVAADFSRAATSGGPEISVSYDPGKHSVTTLSGQTIAGTITENGHVWVADDNGTYHTTTDLGAEWSALYQRMLAGDKLTPIQHLEANAEAVFQNTGLSQVGAAQQETDREDAQRVFDAIAAAMRLDQTGSGIDPSAPLTRTSYLQLEQMLQGNATLEELATQGYGLSKPPSPRYRGYVNDIKNVDTTTLYVGPGLDSGKQAAGNFLGDAIISELAFPSVFENGRWVQLNQNGGASHTVSAEVLALNAMMFTTTLTSADFAAAPATSTTTAAAKAA